MLDKERYLLSKTTLRTDTAFNWRSANPVLSLGEPGYQLPEANGVPGRIKIGDGHSTWNKLDYCFNVTAGAAGDCVFIEPIDDGNLYIRKRNPEEKFGNWVKLPVDEAPITGTFIRNGATKSWQEFNPDNKANKMTVEDYAVIVDDMDVSKLKILSYDSSENFSITFKTFDNETVILEYIDGLYYINQEPLIKEQIAMFARSFPEDVTDFLPDNGYDDTVTFEPEETPEDGNTPTDPIDSDDPLNKVIYTYDNTTDIIEFTETLKVVSRDNPGNCVKAIVLKNLDLQDVYRVANEFRSLTVHDLLREDYYKPLDMQHFYTNLEGVSVPTFGIRLNDDLPDVDGNKITFRVALPEDNYVQVIDYGGSLIGTVEDDYPEYVLLPNPNVSVKVKGHVVTIEAEVDNTDLDYKLDMWLLYIRY